MTRLNFGENFTKSPSKSKSKFYGDRKRNGISFWAFFLSILIYISIFYVFNLSPSALFNTTKFWFFISNTLILIIAVDFGAFSSSIKQDYYEEYVKNAQVRSSHNTIPPSLDFQYNIVQKQEHDDHHPQEKIKDVVVVCHQEVDEYSHEKKLEMIVKDEPKNPKESQEDDHITIVNVDDHENVVEEKKNIDNSEIKCMRSKSTKIIMSADDELLDEKKIQRSQSGRYDFGKAVKKEEENDFSAMSDEELNRRVEEFIRNFNRQIRLQAIRNRQNMYAHEV